MRMIKARVPLSTANMSTIVALSGTRFSLHTSRTIRYLTVRLTDSFNFILLFDGITVRRSTGGVNKLLGQTLRHGLEVAETSLTSSSRK